MFWTDILLLLWTFRSRSLQYCCHFIWWFQVQVWQSLAGFREPGREWQVCCALMAFPAWLPHSVRGINVHRFLLDCRQVLLNLQGRSSGLAQSWIFPVTHLNSLLFHAECNFVETLWMTALLICTGRGGRTVRAADFLFFLILLLPFFSASCLFYTLAVSQVKTNSR